MIPYLALLLAAATPAQQKKEAAELAAMEHHAGTPHKSSSLFVISPETRAKDLEEAFRELQTQGPTSAITFHLHDGREIKNVLKLQSLSGGTLMVFTINSTKGPQTQIIPIEDITGVSL